MPLINRKPFVRIDPPCDLRADEEVFVCRTTKELFRDYNKFFERTILCNSLVWSCQVTGRSELTFQEALDSEERALGVLNSLPVALHPPLLALASLTRRTRMQDVCEDVHGFVRQRFFVGEQVEANLPGKSRQTSLVLEVLSALTHNGAANGHMVDGDGVSDEEEYDDEEKALPTGSGSDSLQRPNSSPDQCYYRVQPLGIEGLDATVVGVDHICRRKGTLTREKLRIFMKRHCELYHGTYRVKPNSALLYKLDTFDLESVFPGGLPAFPRAMQTRARGHSSRSNKSLTQHSPSNAVGTMEVSAQPCMHENETLHSPKPELTYNHTKVNDVLFKDSQYLQQQRELLQKQLDEAKEQLRQKKLEEKQQLKLLRDEKREKMREEKRQHAEKMKEWRRPREDLECEDLQALPKPSPVCTPIPPNLFVDVVMLLEFLHAFGGFFHLKDEFPKGLDLGVLEEALMDSNPNGPLCDLLFFFLSSISAGQADEELERQNRSADHDAVTGLSEALEEVEQDSTKTAISSVAALAAAWPIFHQGCPLNKLELDSCTLSEILRLHVLASGADVDLSNALFRNRQHGGYDTADDPCVELRLKWPSLLRHLALFSVYDLRPEEKVRILHALCGQLLTLVTTREYIEKSFEQLKQARQDLRELRSAGIRRQREEAAARYRRRKNQKLLEQQERVGNNVFPCEPVLESSSTAVDRNSTFEQAEPVLVDSQRDEYPEKTSDDDKVMESNLLSLRSYKLACPQQADTANGKAEASATLPETGTATKVDLAEAERLEQAQALQQQEAERELQKRIWAATARTNVAPLGRDRYFSRYWLFHSLHGLFVEHSGEYFEEQAVAPTPTGTAVDDDGDEGGVSTLPDEGSTTDVQDSAASEVKQGRDTSPSQSGVDTGSTWSVFHSPEQLDELLATLNPRGHREGALREALLQDLDRVRSKLKPDQLQNLIGNEQSPKGRTKATGENLAEGVLEQTLREYLLSLEERIWKGSVGRIKVNDRQIWRKALMTGGYDPQCKELHWGGSRQHKLMWSLSGENTKVHGEGQSPSTDRLQDLKVEQCGGTGPSEGNSTQPANTRVHGLALSLLQMEQAVAHRFLTPPFGNAKKGRGGKKTKKEKDHKSMKQEQEDASCERNGTRNFYISMDFSIFRISSHFCDKAVRHGQPGCLSITSGPGLDDADLGIKLKWPD
uniref:Bromodomain adjacent to zinc finger domain protein 1A n=1 Tax=Eptatretus burgeri TaxID=7764 RepID=A0A8C4WX77_EPTBU